MEENQDAIIRAYAVLSSLRKNIDQPTITAWGFIRSSYVEEFHSILKSLEEIGMDVSEFYIPDSEIQPQLLSSPLEGKTYSGDKYVRESYFSVKLDAILMYLDMKTVKPRKTIGFSPPTKQERGSR
jgi:hypothetical protein